MKEGSKTSILVFITVVVASFLYVTAMIKIPEKMNGKNRNVEERKIEIKKEGSKLIFNKEVINIGKKNRNEEVKAEFVYTNKGEKPVIINAVVPSCGCTLVKYKEGIVMPGESGIIEVELEKKESGYNEKNVRVLTDEGVMPIKLTFRVEIL